jgi:hypothetical protein
MKKLMGLVVAAVLVLAGCDTGNPPPPPEPVDPVIEKLKNDLIWTLGGPPSDPGVVAIVTENVDQKWALISEAKKYFILDLSACTTTGNTFTGQENPTGNDFNIIKDNEYRGICFLSMRISYRRCLSRRAFGN